MSNFPTPDNFTLLWGRMYLTNVSNIIWEFVFQVTSNE